MLAVRYDTNSYLYERFGCFFRTNAHSIEPYKIKHDFFVKRFSAKELTHLNFPIDMMRPSLNIQTMLHIVLNKIADKNKGVFTNPRQIASFLKQPFSKLKLHPELKRDNTIKLEMHKYHDYVIWDTKGTKSKEEAMELFALRSVFEGHRNDYKSVMPIIKIDHELFNQATKGCIASLEPYMHILVIKWGPFTIDYNDRVFRMIFKEWLIPDPRTGHLQNHSTKGSSNYVIANLTKFTDATISAKNGMHRYEFIDVSDTILTFQNSNGTQDRLILRKGKIALEGYVNKSLEDMYDTIFRYGKPESPYNSLSFDSKCISVTNLPILYITQRAKAFIDKVISRILDLSYAKVNIILIGNKGSGKSKLSLIIQEFLSDFTNEKVDIIPSDSYGVWKRSVVNALDNVRPDYRYYANVEIKSTDSLFYYLAKDYLASNDILNIDKYSKCKRNKRAKLLSAFRDEISQYFVTDGTNNEGYFYDCLDNDSARSRVVIFESHSSISDANLPPSDTTFIISPVISTREAVKGRDKNDCVNLFLHDLYADISVINHIAVYPYEWVGLSKACSAICKG